MTYGNSPASTFPAQARGRTRPALTTSAAAALATVALSASVLIAYAWPTHSPSLYQLFTPEHVDLLGMTDSTRQRRAHRVLAALVVISLLAGATLRTQLDRSFDRVAVLVPARLWGLRILGAAVLLWSVARHSRAALLSLAIASSGLAILMTMPRLFDRRSPFAAALFAATLGYAALLLLPPLGRTLDLSGQNLEMVEWHFAIVVSQGDRLAQGLRLFLDITPHYGFLGPTLLALYERGAGLLSFGQHLRLIQGMQVASFILIVAAYVAWGRGFLLPVVLALLMVLPGLDTSYFAVFYPNHSAWRSLGVPVGALVLIFGSRLGPTEFARVAGAVLGVLFLFNPETGSAIGIGFLTYLFLRVRFIGAALPRLVVFVQFFLAAAVPILLFGALFKLMFGYLPLPDFGAGMRTTLARFSSGYGGLPLSLSLGAAWLVMLVHATYEVLRAALARGRLGTRGEVRASLAMIIVVWFGYYANRPHELNLRIFYFLYGFFVIDLLSRHARRRYIETLRKGTVPLGAAALAVVFAAAIPPNAEAIRAALAKSAPAPEARLLSDVWLPGPEAALAQSKSRFVANEAAHGPVFYFSANSYLIPLLSGVFPQLPVAEVFAETFTPNEYEQLVARVLAASPARVLFDDPRSILSGSAPQRHFFQRLRESLLGGYRLSDIRDGWEVWTRSPPESHASRR